MITSPQIRTARAILSAGGSLVDAAKEIGIKASDLDLALWRNLGGRVPEEFKREWRHDELVVFMDAWRRGLTDEQIAGTLRTAGFQRTAKAVAGLRSRRALRINRPHRPEWDEIDCRESPV